MYKIKTKEGKKKMSKPMVDYVHGNFINKKQTSMKYALLNIQIKDR